MHELFEHRCGIFWHMKTHDEDPSSWWHKHPDGMDVLDAASTTDQKSQELQAEGEWRNDGSDKVTSSESACLRWSERWRRMLGRRLEVGTKGRHAKLHTRRATILTAAEPQRRVPTR